MEKFVPTANCYPLTANFQGAGRRIMQKFTVVEYLFPSGTKTPLGRGSWRIIDKVALPMFGMTRAVPAGKCHVRGRVNEGVNHDT